jgi:hypothetical protein
MNTTVRLNWPGYTVDLGEGFRVRMGREGRQLEAVCWLRSHQLGFELAPNVNGYLQRSDVCRSSDEVLRQTESCHAALLGVVGGTILLASSVASAACIR